MPTKSNNIGGRGGKHPGTGRKKTAVKDKYENGNPDGRKLETGDIYRISNRETQPYEKMLSISSRQAYPHGLLSARRQQTSLENALFLGFRHTSFLDP